MNKVIFLLSLFVMTIMVSCYYDNEEELYGNDCQYDKATYTDAVEPILVNYCYQCHSTQSNLTNVKLEGYSAVMPFAQSGSLLGSIRHDSGFVPMPQDRPKLSDCEIDIIAQWIAEGAQNN